MSHFTATLEIMLSADNRWRGLSPWFFRTDKRASKSSINCRADVEGRVRS